MATNTQNAISAVSAIFNVAATPAQVNRVGAGFATQEGRLAEYQTASQDLRAAFLLKHLKAYSINAVKAGDVAIATAQAAASAIAAIDEEFPT